VRGEATRTLSPDQLIIGLTIESFGLNTSESQAQSATDTAKVKAALLAAGLNESEIQTSSYYTYAVYNDSCYSECYPYYYADYDSGYAASDVVYEAEPVAAARCIDADGEAMAGPNGEVYRYGSADSDAGVAGVSADIAYLDIAPMPPYPCKYDDNCTVIGYKTFHVLMIKTGKTTDGGEFVEAALSAANAARVDYIYFSIKEETRVSVESELQASAAAAAKAKAENIARGLGAKLGKIVSINPDYYYPYYPVYAYDRSAYAGGAESAPAAPPTEIFPTDTTMSSSITVVYELVQ
jgi:uncharacterized protein YggE